MDMNKKGFTLIETMAVVGILGAASLTIMTNQTDEIKENKMIFFLEESLSVVSAVDEKLSIEGFDPSNWNQTNWADESEIVSGLIRQELTSLSGSNCDKDSFLPCTFWSEETFKGFDVTSNLEVDNVGFIDSFNLTISFEDEESFSQNFKEIKQALTHIQGLTYNELSGMYFVNMVSLNTGNILSSAECISESTDCAINLSLERSGGNDYFRVDGSVAIEDNHITFVDTKDAAPLECLRWRQSTSGTWNLTPMSSQEDCGIGIYSETGYPVAVDVIADNGTFGNTLIDVGLNYECNVYKKAAASSSNVIVTDGTSPCGMLGEDIVQVVDSASAKVLFAEEGNINLVHVNRLITDSVKAETMTVTQLAEFKAGAEANGYINVGGTTNIDLDLTINSSTNVTGDVDIGGTLIVDTVTASNKVSAPTGNFTNIDNEIARLENKREVVQDNVDSLGGTWITGSWGSCNTACGGGFKYRSVTCSSGDYCTGSIPSNVISCNTHACPTLSSGVSSGSSGGGKQVCDWVEWGQRGHYRWECRTQ